MNTIPKLIEEINTFFSENRIAIVPKHPEKKKKYKTGITRDNTPIDQYIYDEIQRRYKQFRVRNDPLRQKNKEVEAVLVAQLNEHLEMNKSRTYYADIWHGKVKRKSLPVGDPIYKQWKW